MDWQPVSNGQTYKGLVVVCTSEVGDKAIGLQSEN
jgi:hypothetical protein